MVRALAVLSVMGCATAFAAEDEPFTIDDTTALKLTVGHAFPTSEARERVGYLLEYWSRRFGVESEWRGDRVFLTGRVWGIDIRAVFTVEERMVRAVAHDPGTLLASAAQRYVTKKLRKYLHPTYDEE